MKADIHDFYALFLYARFFLLILLITILGAIKCIIIYYFNYKNTIVQQCYKIYNISKILTGQNLNLNTVWSLNH